MATTRRGLLGAGASAALGLIPLGMRNSVLAQTSPTAATPTAQAWDDGELTHLLPTSSHDRILIKASFKQPLDAAPLLSNCQNWIFWFGRRGRTTGHAKPSVGVIKEATPFETSNSRHSMGPWCGDRRRY